jgi:hypothetical protein
MLFQPLALADILEFPTGERVVLPARTEGDTVIVDAPSGPLRFHRSDFRRITPTTSPAEQWPARRAAALRSGAQAQFTAAWWALEHGMATEAASMLRQAHATEPGHQPTSRLIPLLDRLAAPAPDPELPAIASRLQAARGDHVILLHEHTEAEAAERVELLERVLRTFYLQFAAAGLDLELPATKLVSVWFKQRSDYRAALRAEGAIEFLSTRGYFHRTKKIVYTYDWRDDPRLRRKLALIEAAPSSPASSAERDRLALLVDLEQRDVNLGTAAHELIHHLVAVSGLAPRYDAWPIWLHEGLAMQFDVIRSGRWAGFDRINAERLASWRVQRPEPPLAPLIRDRGFGHGYRATFYAQAWALVYFLRKDRPAELITWLDLLRQPSPDSRPPADRFDATFRLAFGADLQPTEAAWHARLRALQNPSEPPLTPVQASRRN